MATEGPTELMISITKLPGKARRNCAAKLGATVLHLDVLDPRNSSARKKFLEQVVARAQEHNCEITIELCEQLVLQQLEEADTDEGSGAATHLCAISDRDILEAVGIEVIGEHADQSIELYATRIRKSWRLKTPARWPAEEMIQALGPEIERVVNFDGQHLPSMLTTRDVQRAVARAASGAPRIRDEVWVLAFGSATVIF
jgi:hypothetical protein